MLRLVVRRGRVWCFAAAVALILTAVPAGASQSHVTHAAGERVRFGVCPIDLPTPRPVDCGKLRVPEVRGDPDSRIIRVAFAIVRAPAPVRPDPIVFVMGGPSYPAIDGFSMRFVFDHTASTQHRDLILVDLRGTRSSRPFLNCPEFDRLAAETWPEGPTQEQDETAQLACRDRLARIADLRHYGSIDTAMDLRALRKALGYEQWNVMAFSAGGEPAFQLLRIDPAGTRAAVIDAPITGVTKASVDRVFWTEIPRQLLSGMLAGCEAQPSCNKAFPNLKSRFWHEVEQLEAHPHLVHFKVEGGGSIPFRVYGHFFQQDVAFLMADPFGKQFAPAILDELLRHGIDPLYDFTIGPPFPIADVVAEGRTIAYRCREYISHKDRDAIQTIVDRYPRWAWVTRDGFRSEHRRCTLWDVGRDNRVGGFTDVDVPTLMFEGQWDPAVPNAPIEAEATHLHDGTFVQVPDIGHGALVSWLGWQDCPRSIATFFLNHPNATQDTSCVDDMPHTVFETSLPGLPDGRAADLRGALRAVRERLARGPYARLALEGRSPLTAPPAAAAG